MAVDMNDKRPLFILAGHGPYDNRGCEAIVRGTVGILRHYFDNPKFVVVSHYMSTSQYKQQIEAETDKDILQEKAVIKFEPLWFLQKCLQMLCPALQPYITYRKMMPYLKDSMAVLSIGGDSYSLDYGMPAHFTALDDLVLSKKKPLIIWGASVGPFSKLPEYERYMVNHLKNVDGIFARESESVEYLERNGVIDNVYRVADPAFLLNSAEPVKEKFSMKIQKDAIGINLSPLMAKYVTNGNLAKWVEHAADIIRKVSDNFVRPIYLIPHVTSQHTNDHEFMGNVLSLLGKTKEEIVLLPSNLNAAETKWVISQLTVFAGARTHSTIASLSSCVPTLSFVYSIKAEGINKDIFGDTRYCIMPDNLMSKLVIDKFNEIIQDSERIRNQINLSLPRVKAMAMNAGKYLKEILESKSKN